MRTILLLDDEQVVRDIAEVALTRAGYRLLETADPEEAIAAAASYRSEIALFITNHKLPDGRTGREVAEEILKTRPGMPVLHISGSPEEQLRTADNLTLGSFYLAKPFLPRQLVQKVTAIFE